ncbi:hypothetical protein CEP52_013581 [Fusarium oligoseptatum]|uniref:F-box domain-containing protein n=1 Tax=Fusarium oligoseptatum TaxID=2604345 RepID=A0A428SSV5_9HYPO|nr:hypothetical protein CEP52_013581 [Fusarium oligoseptatum]
MQQEPLENPEPLTHQDNPFYTSSSQHGLLHRDPRGLRRALSRDSSGPEPRSASALRRDSGHDVDADLLDEELRRLSLSHGSAGRLPAPGQRISEYESAMTPPTPKKALGFKVTKRTETPSDGVQLTDFPNELLTHIFSHLHSDSHAAIALVSKRFYALITSSHAWRMAFLRYFPGHEALEVKTNVDIWAHSSQDLIQSESRYFARLTPMASWRKEYLLRTRLMRSLARGKPGASAASGGIGASVRSGKKTSAVLTFNSKLPWLVSSLHAVFTNGKKPPRAIHGAADLGVASISDPTNGRIEKWGFVDPFSSMQLDEVVPNLVPFGLGEGPAATPNVLDVSQPYGLLAGEGFPGGRAYFRTTNENRGRYLGGDSGVVDTYPDIPKIPEMSEAICSVWLAKSQAVPANTNSMIGMLTGSTLGVVSSYAIGGDSGPQRYQAGEITARWVLSPGVPIISLKVDDNYSQKRKSAGRIFAVALNALGEVYYLTETPSAQNQAKSEDITKNAWYAGRSVYWHLLDSTRRVARPDDLDKNAIRGAYSPRSPSNSMNLSKSQLTAEAREIEKFLRHKPAHFRKVCEGWDMQRKMEVDFASDDGQGAGESIFVIDCGLAEGRPANIQRYTRSLISQEAQSSSVILAPAPPALPIASQSSLFGTAPGETTGTPEQESPGIASPASASSPDSLSHLHEWDSCPMNLKGHFHATVTSVGLDRSNTAVLTLAEDPLYTAEEEIPGRRSRLFAIGTDAGAVLVWNARDNTKGTGIDPVRQIQTESPEVSCVALTAFYDSRMNKKAKERARLQTRFGVGALGDLTEEEALRYAQMVSEEAFLEEQRRTSDSAADASLDTASTFSETTVDTITPEPSITEMTPPTAPPGEDSRRMHNEDDYEQQIQQAIRLSLMEGVNENGHSPPAMSSGDYEFSLTYKAKPGKKGKHSGLSSPGASKTASSSHAEPRDYDLELALKLSMEDSGHASSDVGLGVQFEEFPPLETEGVGKGKGVQRW